jgi:integrase
MNVISELNMKITKQTKYLTTENFQELFKTLIKDTTKGRRVQKSGKRIRSSTTDNYIYTQKLLTEYVEQTKNELRIYLVNNLTTKEKEQAKKYYKKFFSDFTDFLYFKKDFYDNYVGLIVKSIRTFFNYLTAEHNLSIGEYHKLFYVPNEEIPIVVLSPEQLNYLISDAELEEKLPESLKVIKDVFVFGCTVALRFSDLMGLKNENLLFYNDTYHLKVTSLKTSTNTTIKLPKYAVDILKKYHKKQKTLIPTFSKSYLNKSFKKLASYLAFKETLIKERTKRGVKYPIYKNKAKRLHYTLADHITTHTMRRTAITYMLRLGMPELAVRKISGHSANSKEFFRYIELAQLYIDEHTDKVFEKITQSKPSNREI